MEPRQAFGKIIKEGTSTIVTDWATAELAKRAANSFLATKISFINAMVEVCEASDANVAELRRGPPRPRRHCHRHRPQGLDNARKLHPELGYLEDPIAAVQDAGLLLCLTQWPQFTHIGPKCLAHRTVSPKVIVARGTLRWGGGRARGRCPSSAAGRPRLPSASRRPPRGTR
ncbi:hypothetical protein [Streptomyces sp. MN13]